MTGNDLKVRRIALMVSRAKIADQMKVSQSRVQQVEDATRLSERMKTRYLRAIEEILLRRKSLGGAK
jgi:predicted transcriptional regulator